MNNSTTRRWSNLSPFPLKMINNKLNEHYLKITMRLVCKKWRNSVDPPLARLDHFLPKSISFHQQGALPLCLVRASVYLFSRNQESAPWWLAAVEKAKPEEHFRLFHPLTRSRIPMEQLDDDFYPNLDSIELSKGCNLRWHNGINPFFSHLPQDFCIHKVILWCDGDQVQEMATNYTVVMLHDRGKLDCFRLPYEPNDEGVFYIDNITPITMLPTDEPNSCSSNLRFDDIEIWKDGMLWAVDREARLFGFNYQSLQVTDQGGGGIPTYHDCGSIRLMVTGTSLWCIVCIANDIVERADNLFMIYEANDNLEWEPIVSLEKEDYNEILFVGFDACFICISEILDRFPGNCIVFPKRLYPMFTDNEARDGVEFHSQLDYLDLCMCRYRLPGYHYPVVQQFYGFPYLSSVFWPPPASMFRNFDEIIYVHDSNSES